MIERQAISDARSAIVAGDAKALMTERTHHVEHLMRDGALGIVAAIVVRRRAAAFAITGEIGENDSEALRQSRRDTRPANMGLREAVEQQQRRPRARDADENV